MKVKKFLFGNVMIVVLIFSMLPCFSLIPGDGLSEDVLTERSSYEHRHTYSSHLPPHVCAHIGGNTSNYIVSELSLIKSLKKKSWV